MNQPPCRDVPFVRANALYGVTLRTLLLGSAGTIGVLGMLVVGLWREVQKPPSYILVGHSGLQEVVPNDVSESQIRDLAYTMSMMLITMRSDQAQQRYEDLEPWLDPALEVALHHELQRRGADFVQTTWSETWSATRDDIEVKALPSDPESGRAQWQATVVGRVTQVVPGLPTQTIDDVAVLTIGLAHPVAMAKGIVLEVTDFQRLSVEEHQGAKWALRARSDGGSP